MSFDDKLTPEEAAELFFGDFSAALLLFEEVSAQVGEVRARPREFSHRAARAFAEGLILDPSVDAARHRMQQDRGGSVSFYELAHELRDRLRTKQPQFVARSDGQHEPFLLLASAVLNRFDWLEQNNPDEIE
jgi:hypothetical protein